MPSITTSLLLRAGFLSLAVLTLGAIPAHSTWMVSLPSASGLPTVQAEFDSADSPAKSGRPSPSAAARGALRDCNTNGVDDTLDIAAGTSDDCNSNGIPDECDVLICTTNGLWDGFQPNPPFEFLTPMSQINYITDAVFWDNPLTTAYIYPFGCETGDFDDNAVQVEVDQAVSDPRAGYVESEFFRTETGALPPQQQVYSLRFLAKIDELNNAETDWEFSIHDGRNARKVANIRFSSTVSTATGFPGKIVVEYPAGTYIDTGVSIVVGECYDFQVDLDNINGTVQVTIDGHAKLSPPRPPLQSTARQMDYFRIQPVLNGASSHRTTVFRIDHVDLCRIRPTGGDCNTNAVFDECDIAAGTSFDCNSNAVPDECDPDCDANGFPDDCDISVGTGQDCNTNGVPDTCDIAEGISGDCNANGVPDECDISAGTAQDCNNNGIPDACDTAAATSGDCNTNGLPDECDISAGVELDCNANSIPDACEVAAGSSEDCNSNGFPDECDLTAFQLAKLLAADAAAENEFGQSVAICGETAVIGAYRDDDAGFASGSAYVFRRSGGIWTQEAKLIASDAMPGDRFGNAVAVSDDIVVVGAYGDDDGGSASGSAYVFVRSDGAWTQQAKLTAADAADEDLFGVSVSVSGDTAVVGAVWDDDMGADSGSAYVFVRSDGLWTQQAKLTAADGFASDFFGTSVAVSGDTTVVGAYWDDDMGSGSGSAYVFVRSGSVWTQQAKLVAADGATSDHFGDSVSVSGDTAVVGTPSDDDAGSASGSAYVFVRSGGVWTQQAKLTAADAAAGDRFGASVALSGDTAVIGAYRDVHAGIRSGSAYVFVRSGGVWAQHVKLVAADPAANDLFGISVGVSGATAVIGAPWDADAGFDSGSAYLFTLAVSEDCNANETPDECDITAGTSRDCNTNGVPDECEALLAGDLDGDGDVDLFDYSLLTLCFGGDGVPVGSDCICSDIDGDGDVDLADAAELIGHMTGP